MNFRFLYIFLFLLFTAKFFCQDIIAKKDSTNIVAKILEVSQDEIKYKLLSYLEGPLYVIEKNDVAYIVYSNGYREVFKNVSIEPTITKQDSFYYNNPIIWQGSKPKPHVPAKLGDYININLQAGFVINNAFSNLPCAQPGLYITTPKEYSGNNNDKYYCNPNIGFNFMFGKNRYVKHVIGINYLRSQGEFDVKKSARTSNNYYGFSDMTSSLHYVSTVNFINFITGIRFNISRHFNIEFLVAGNYVANTNEKITGTITTKNFSGGTMAYPISENVEYVNTNNATKDNRIMNSSVSVCPRICYEFNIKQRKLGMYYSYNMSHEYFLSWHMIGITYYPFKKLSTPIDNKKIEQSTDVKKKMKLFSGMKLNIDAALVLNRGYTNTQENYSGIKPSDPKIYKPGYNIGINFYHGKTDYFKHYVSAYFIQSQADLLRKTYMYTYENNNAYENEVINTTTYNSKVHFLNFGTGVRFIAFKHLIFDNGFALNMPVYSKNTIQHNETVNRYDSNSNTLINSTSITTEKSNSNDMFIEKTNWVFTAKIGYDFNIKQSKFGVFLGWNYGWSNNAQWHMLGLTYYPFKKLR